MPVKISHEEFLERLERRNPHFKDFEFLSEYTYAAEKIKIRCKKCGNIWEPRAGVLNTGYRSGCPKCATKRRINMVTFTHEEFLKKVKERNPHFEDFDFLSKYTTSDNRIKIRCKKCGNIWEPTAGMMINSQKPTKCPKCCSNKGGHKPIYPYDKFLEKVKKNNPHYEEFKFLNKYNGISNTLEVQCKKCGHIWEPVAHTLAKGSGCPKCAKVKLYTHEEFLERLKNDNPHYNDFEFLSEYKKIDSIMNVRCKNCGYEWKPLANTLAQGCGCPKCLDVSTSFMEQFLYNALCNVLGEDNVLNRNRSILDGKELDIYIPDKKFAIEIGSWHWHKKKFEKDMTKYKLCQEKGIKLLIIYDYCRDNFPKDINYDFIWTYKDNLSKDCDSLKDIFYKCLDMMSIDSTNDMDWKVIKSKSYVRRIVK